MSNPYIGEIRLVPMNFAPLGWQFCDGSLLPINEYEALFTLLGTAFGGDGRSTFGLPDLRGRAAIHAASNYPFGYSGGAENVTIDVETMASHSHVVEVGTNLGTSTIPAGHYLGESPASLGYVYSPGPPNAAMNQQSVGQTGSGQAHENMQPYLALNYIISLYGVFPSQD